MVLDGTEVGVVKGANAGGHLNLNDTQLGNFVSRIKLTADQKKSYQAQIQGLVDKVNACIDAHPEQIITKVIRAGSWKKGTALRPKPAHPLDIDLVFYLANSDTKPEVEELQRHMISFLVEAYPNKTEEDFKGGDKTVGLVFKGSGLEADLVPVVPLTGEDNYVWQPSKTDPDQLYVTSVADQIQFARDAKTTDRRFASLVRMLKVWRARKEIELSSFAIELLVAYLAETEGPTESLEHGCTRFFNHLSLNPMPEVTFDRDSYGDRLTNQVPAYIADPSNLENNVVGRLSSAEWEEIQSEATAAFEALAYAQCISRQGDTIDRWKAVFGPSFSIEAEQA